MGVQLNALSKEGAHSSSECTRGVVQVAPVADTATATASVTVTATVATTGQLAYYAGDVGNHGARLANEPRLV